MIDVEKYFLAIANTTNDMIHLNDSDGRIIYANQATEKTLGYPLNELVNTYSFAIIHPDDRETIKKDMLTISPGNYVMTRGFGVRWKYILQSIQKQISAIAYVRNVYKNITLELQKLRIEVYRLIVRSSQIAVIHESILVNGAP